MLLTTAQSTSIRTLSRGDPDPDPEPRGVYSAEKHENKHKIPDHEPALRASLNMLTINMESKEAKPGGADSVVEHEHKNKVEICKAQ